MKPIVLIFFLFFLGESARISGTAVCLTQEERKLYDLIMAYRKSKGLKSIPLSAKLTQVAQTHARDLVENFKFDPNGKCNPHSWSKKGNWTACCYTADHKQAKCMWDKPKEIAGYEKPGYEIAYYSSKGASAQEGLDGWKVSPAHNPLLINSEMWSKVEWKAIGIGIYGEYGIVWFGELPDNDTPGQCL
ncbi:MAG TPA: CAP domain-containing protein [Cyclobacteriaceae bacterium]|nr:CAP domain-containing protein [Cyclobacteriaceae bacterium]